MLTHTNLIHNTMTYTWMLMYMLTFGVNGPIEHHLYIGDFTDEWQCQAYLHDNKVKITKNLFEWHDDGDLTGYDYFCEGRYGE
mgnify:FL=1